MPWEFTLRELHWMAWGKANEQWNHTASLMALLAAINTDPKAGGAPSPADYHPYMDSVPLPKATPEMVKAMFALAGMVPRE